MSKRKALTQSELENLVNNFGQMSDDSELEPFSGSDSDDPSFQYDSDYDDSSSSSETGEKRSTFLSKKNQHSVSLQNKLSKPQSTGISATTSIIEAPSSEAPSHEDLHALSPVPLPDENVESDIEMQSPDLLPYSLPDEDENLGHSLETTWGPLIGNYKPIAPFSGPSGVIPDVAALLANGKPADFFDAVVDNRIISLICNQTNIYATRKVLDNDATPGSRLREWTPTTNAEIRKFLGLIAWMGLVKMPSIADYWSKDEIFSNNFANKIMSRNRFELLLRMIHFADNGEADQTDKLYKLTPLVNMLTANFKSLYVPEEYICVDETLLPFRGRLGFRQYIKTKRHRYGVKLFKVCSGLGYTYNLKIYAGKEDTNVTPEKVVLYLVDDLINKGRTLVTDNWYTSLPLAQKMLKNNTHLLGTIRKNRKGLPKEVVKAKLKKGDILAMENEDGITISNWKDQRNILMLSTKHGNEMIEVPCKRHQVKLKPAVILDYNKGKGSVDISDQMGAYSNPLRKSLKWFRKVAFELLLTTSMVNAFILHRLVTGEVISVTDFKKQVIKHLVSSEDTTDLTEPEQQTTTKPKSSHELEAVSQGNKHKRRKICKNCYKKNSVQEGRKYAMNKTKKVDTFCKSCDNQPFLCLTCFNELHR